jgi:hypothetical protein
MNRLIILTLIVLSWSLPACVPGADGYTDLEPIIVDTTDAQIVVIQVNHGEVIVLESDNHFLQVSGQVRSMDGTEYQTSSEEKQIFVNAHVNTKNSAGVPLRMEVRVPKNMEIKIITESASVFVTHYDGTLEVASTAGNIAIEEVIGRITLRSNRGNITVQKSSGRISVVGNYGALTTQDVTGETSVSTIMGKVEFGGPIKDGDLVRLETDHGSVSVNLHQDSDLSFEAYTTSGEMLCLLPYLSSTTRICDGKIGTGNGGLKIRTVSGAVTMQLLP